MLNIIKIFVWYHKNFIYLHKIKIMETFLSILARIYIGITFIISLLFGVLFLFPYILIVKHIEWFTNKH